MAESFIELKQPIDPHLRRWMLFVDGENLTLRAQQLAAERQLTLSRGPTYDPDVYVWIPGVLPTQNIVPGARLGVQGQGIRAYYYTSLVGDEQRIVTVKEALWTLGFSPEVFKKSRQDQKAKGRRYRTREGCPRTCLPRQLRCRSALGRRWRLCPAHP